MACVLRDIPISREMCTLREREKVIDLTKNYSYF